MVVTSRPPVLVVVELSGGNDFMNTVVPYGSSDYYDARPNIQITEDRVLPLNDTVGLHPSAWPLKKLYDKGHVAIVQGVGYPSSSRSHFRAMFDCHTCEPERTVTEGWLAKVVRELDPEEENVLTGVNFGITLPQAMAAPGVAVTSIGDLDNYGLMRGISDIVQRSATLELFKEMYGPAVGTGGVMDYLSEAAEVVLGGADMLKKAPTVYESNVEYAANPIARSLRDVARVHLADLGTRVFYVSHGGYDTHANEIRDHDRLLVELSSAVMDFQQDLRDHDALDNVLLLVFTEFGRRVKDNGTGTDHGAGGGSFLIGPGVNGGLYSEYPPLDSRGWLDGEDLQHTIDFRSVYTSVLEQWMQLDAVPIVGRAFEQIQAFR